MTLSPRFIIITLKQHNLEYVLKLWCILQTLENNPRVFQTSEQMKFGYQLTDTVQF